MSVICPTVLADTPDEFERQMRRVANLGHRLQIDLTDGDFAKTATIKPEEAWWPVGLKADIHLMFSNPQSAIEALVPHQPNLIIIHAESDADVAAVAKYCHDKSVGLGIALLPDTEAETVSQFLSLADHVLIFSGDLGSFGGHANLALLDKVRYLKEQKPEIEIGWDGGVNPQNVSELVFGGVDVLNVGGFIQKADDPEKAYHSLLRIADETGTT